MWQPGILEAWPGVLSSSQLLDGLQTCYSHILDPFPALRPNDDVERACRRLQVYWVDSQMRGLDRNMQGPCWASQKAKRIAALAMGVQKGGPNSKWAREPLLPHGIGKNMHMSLASCLPSPFHVDGALDQDAHFAVRCNFVFGPSIRTWRRQQSRAMQCLAKWLAPIESALTSCMHGSVAAVAKQRKPACMTAMSILLRWPDLTLGVRFVEGFSLLVYVESPSLFRVLDPHAHSAARASGFRSQHGL